MLKAISISRCKSFVKENNKPATVLAQSSKYADIYCNIVHLFLG